MTQYDSIGVDKDGLIGIVEIQRPPHNFFDYRMIRDIANAFDEFDRDQGCRAIVLAAQGKSFCAGANFGSGDGAEADQGFTEEGFKTDTVILYEEALRLFGVRKPVVAAVHGAAIGGGLGVSLAADFRVTCKEARFSANFAALGIHPGFGLTVTLPELIGHQQASLMFYTARRVTGEEACHIGLADILVEQSRVRDEAMELAGKIAANAPLAVISVRATMRTGLVERLAQRVKHELAEQQWLRATADAEEGIRAVSERRAGRFTGK